MRAVTTIIVSMLALLTITGGASFAGDVVIKGSTTVLPVAQAAAEAFMNKHPEVSISLSGGGSGNGIKALIDGSTDIANSSRFLKDSEIKLALEKGSYPVPHRVAMDCVVPVVHTENQVSNLTLSQLKDIYTGKVTNWKELGGGDMQIVIVSRDTSSGTYEVWHSKVLSGEKVTPKALLQASNGAVAQVVSNNRHAIGYVGIGYMGEKIKPVTVEGIKASPAAALTGSYPISRELFMFTSGWPSGDILGFLNFLTSPEGQRIVAKEGFVPIYQLD